MTFEGGSAELPRERAEVDGVTLSDLGREGRGRVSRVARCPGTSEGRSLTHELPIALVAARVYQ